MTRLWTAGSQVRSSLRKIEWITFSTDLSVRNSDPAIAALFFPSAISRRTSRSRGVSWLSGESSARVGLGDEGVDDLGIHDGAALRHGADRGRELLDVADALLQEVGTALAAALEEGERVARGRVLAEHDDADLGVRLAQPLAAWMPSSAPPGGMRMSVTTTSGRSASTAASSESRSPQTAATSRSSWRLQQAPDAFADEVLVFGEHEPDRHGRRIRR